MPYTAYSYDSLTEQIGILLDDQTHAYWQVNEIHYALTEALYVWGALTNYWRGRGTFNITPNDPSPFYSLSTKLPVLRPRNITLNSIVEQVQYACLEPPSFTGVGSSGQISINSIKQSIQRARNRCAIDFIFPYTISTTPISAVPQDGLLSLPANATFVHRAAWLDDWSKRWTTLYRSDAWAIDRNPSDDPLPSVYSESQLAPLTLQLAPPPLNPGTIEVMLVESELINTSDPEDIFNFPNEWAHAIKWAALSDIFGGQSQNYDPLRTKYAELRYSQAATFARDARSITRVTINGNPIPLNPLYSLDTSLPYWRNQVTTPTAAGCLYDMVAFDCIPKTTFGITADVIQAAPIPITPDLPVQIGPEDITAVLNYVTHILTFKCGGSEFEASFAQYDDYMQAVAGRGQINKAKIRYLRALFGQPQQESAERPDQLKATNNA